MITKTVASALCALLLLQLPAYSLVFNPVSVQLSGFDIDAVVENNAVAGSDPNAFTGVSEALDLTNNVFYQSGLSGSVNGLPTNGQISATTGGNTFNFQLANYGTGTGLTKNALQIAPAETQQTLTFTATASYQALAFLGFSTEAQNSNAIGSVVVNFTDSSSTTFADVLDFPDWYTGAGTAAVPSLFNSQGRVQNTTGSYNQNLVNPLTSSSGGQLFASSITLSAGDQLKQVQSVTFSMSSSTPSDRTYVVAVAAVPEPNTVALLALAGAAAFLRRSRVKKRC